ncbi:MULTISPECIES: hypothetical protein [unclassified Blastococcus]
MRKIITSLSLLAAAGTLAACGGFDELSGPRVSPDNRYVQVLRDVEPDELAPTDCEIVADNASFLGIDTSEVTDLQEERWQRECEAWVVWVNAHGGDQR